ncbi:MAG TPA: HIT domain-containing protein [Acidimicrobiia bacterium]|nr:HIT domain-containing protein [Acidimicrobiia bacterium]
MAGPVIGANGARGECVFCTPSAEVLGANDLAIAVMAGYPVSPGHALIVPRRHEPDFFSLTAAEQTALIALVNPVREVIAERFAPDAFNLGVNAGKAAGQTIQHVHLHVIPRYAGDVAEPRGGVRWVLPETARYW